MTLLRKLFLIPVKFRRLKQVLNEGNALRNFQADWRKHNPHNTMVPTHVFPAKLVSVGKGSYGPLCISYWEDPAEKLTIGNYVSVGEKVQFLLGGNHYSQGFSNYPFQVKLGQKKNEAYSKGPIIVKDDVWIGFQAMILSGVTIGQGAVVAAGSIVTRDVPAYAVVGGNPARVIKYRFTAELIQELVSIDFSKLDENFVRENMALFYRDLDLAIIKEIKAKALNG